jgi:hypothetical protein
VPERAARGLPGAARFLFNGLPPGPDLGFGRPGTNGFNHS